jgi:phospholipase D1/2
MDHQLLNSGQSAPGRRPNGNGTIFRPGYNVWRVARAHRATPLVDAAAYFQAVRAAMRAARHSILIAGWDIDSRTRLVGPTCEADDDLPIPLAGFLTALVQRRPELSIRILLWNYSLVYAAEREPMPNLALGWGTPPQVEFCLDDVLPVAASHHQKLVVIDDAVAFCGGLDLTGRRWDTPAHEPDNPHRVDFSDMPYPPFHDVQIMVDGPAAAALGDLVRWRWARAVCQAPGKPSRSGNDPWPAEIEPMFRNVDIGIARTMPACFGEAEIREVERSYLDMIGCAERSIYIENQFLTALPIAEGLIRRLREKPELEVAIIVPQTHLSWLEHVSMLAGRIRFRDAIAEAGFADRVRLLHPEVVTEEGAAQVKIHSKLMIVDDRLLRIGSANLCNRSMGVDTECDLLIDAAGSAETARAIGDFRAALLAEHCGANASEVAALQQRTESLFATLDAVAGGTHRLCPIDDGPLEEATTVVPVGALADPERPIGAGEYLSAFDTAPSRIGRTSLVIRSAIAVLVVIGAVLAWRHTSLAELARPDTLTAWLSEIAQHPWAPIGIILMFIAGGLIAFPVTVLIAGTAATYGVWPGLPIAAAGTLASAYLGYLVGQAVGAEPLKRLFGHRVNRIRRNIVTKGILAVATIRLAPVAPFTLVNLAIGAARIPLLDYMIGTAVGLAPGLVVMSLLGEQFLDVLKDPSGPAIAVIVALLLTWVALAFGLQALVTRWRR